MTVGRQRFLLFQRLSRYPQDPDGTWLCLTLAAVFIALVATLSAAGTVPVTGDQLDMGESPGTKNGAGQKDGAWGTGLPGKAAPCRTHLVPDPHAMASGAVEKCGKGLVAVSGSGAEQVLARDRRYDER